MFVRHACLTVKTATVRDLRNSFPKIASWISDGETVEITRGGKLFARLAPARPYALKKFKMPNIKARLDEAFGAVCYESDDLEMGILESRGNLS